MHIALLAEGIWPLQVGGMEKHSWYMVEYLSRMGWKVDVYYPADEDSVPVFPDGRLRGITEIPVPWPPKGRFPGHYVREAKRFSDQVARRLQGRLSQYGLVYAQGLAGWKLMERKHAGLACPPVWVNFHGLEMFQHSPGIRNFLIRTLLRGPVLHNLRFADKAVSLGTGLTRILKGILPDPASIVEIPIGIGEDWLVSAPAAHVQPPVMVFAGRDEWRKGLQVLMPVLEALPASVPVRMEFIGPVPESKRIHREGIRYHGLVREESRIREILRGCDCLVLPSLAEGLPTVMLEAMASGCAVIASDVGAVSDLVDGNGWLVRPGDPAALQNAIKELYGLPPVKRDQFRARSVDIVREKYLWEKVARRIAEEL